MLFNISSMTLNILTLTCIAVISYILVYKNIKEYMAIKSNDTIEFFNQLQTSTFLIQDHDNYVRNMSSPDLYARRANTSSEYLSIISQCAYSFDLKEKNKLIRCAKKADEFLSGYKYKNMLNCKLISQIPWKFALTKKNELNDTQYEDGLPHTRQNVIFLSKYIINDEIADDTYDDMLVSTLIHEKVHIYQRYNSIDNLIKHIGWHEVPKIHIPKKKLALKRCNPDINNKTYSKNGDIIIFSYKNEYPYDINDVENINFTIEHPYEEIAYDIANEYLKMTMKSTLKFL